MAQRAKIQVSLDKIVEALGAKKQRELAVEIEEVREFVAPKPSPVREFWQDEERSARAREAMKEAGKSRRAQLQLTWRTSGAEQVVEYAEAAKLVGKAEATVRIAISKGSGVAHFSYRDDVITIRRI